MLNWRYLLASIAIVGFGMFGYLTYTDQLPSWLNGRFFLSQVTPIEQTDLSYLQTLPSPLIVSSLEDLQQKFIETLLVHTNEFDKTSAVAAEIYLKQYYKMPLPIPAPISAAVTAASQKFLLAQTIIPQTPTVTITPFLNEVLSILANHEVSTNNYQAVKRSQTSKSLLDSLIKEL